MRVSALDSHHRPGWPLVFPNYGNWLEEGKPPMSVPSRPFRHPSCCFGGGNLAAMFASQIAAPDHTSRPLT
jgi:hypothetical protein